MGELLLSVIVPVYNAAATLNACAASILDQLPQDSELLLVDDGSADGCAALCDALAAADARVRALHQPNGGASAARNAGLAAARGRYLQFVDADDQLMPGLYAAALPHLAGADLFFFGIAGPGGLPRDRLPAGPVPGLASLRADFPYYLVETGLFAALYNKIYRACLLRGLCFDPALRINEDLQFNMQALARCGAVFFDPTPYYLYNDTADGSLSRRLRTDLLDAEVYTRPAVLGFLSACGLNGEEAASLLRRRQGNVAAAQCALLLGRPGKLTFSQYRALFSRALGPAHCRAAVLAWVKQNYSAAPRAFYSACVRLRLAGGLAALCRLRGRSCP